MSRISTQRGHWLSMLAKLTSPMEATAAAQAFAAYAPMLTQFPDAAFTSASLEHVASQCTRGVPSYGELRAALAEWWRDNRPTPTGLPAPLPEKRPEPTDEERAAVAAIVRALTAEMRAPKAIAPAPTPAPTRQYPQLSRATLNAAYAAERINAPKVVS